MNEFDENTEKRESQGDGNQPPPQYPQYQTPPGYQQGYQGYQQGYGPPPGYQPPPGYYQQYGGYGETRYVGFLEAYKAYWVNYVNFNDRTSRAGYWWVFLANCVIAIVLVVIFFSATASAVAIAGGAAIFVLTFFPLFIWIWVFANLIPSLAIIVRRLHDTGKRWPWIFLFMIPYAGFIIQIIFLVMDSKFPPENQFGVLRQV